MLKKLAFLSPRPDLTFDQARSYWRTVHGPLVAASPGYSTFRRSYRQNHVVEPGPIGRGVPYLGMAEFELPGRELREDEWTATPAWRDRVRPDEERFLDSSTTVFMSAEERTVVPGTGGVKLVVLAARRPGTSLDEHARGLAERARRLSEVPDVARVLRGYTQDVVIEGSARTPAGPLPAGVAIDSVEELWFDSAADLRAAFAAPGAREVDRASGAHRAQQHLASFVAEEIWFFREGRVVVPSPAGRQETPDPSSADPR